MQSGYFTISCNPKARQKRATINHTKDCLHPKMMMCIWWNWNRVPKYEPLLEKEIIGLNNFYTQLDQLKIAINEVQLESVKRKGIIFHQSNTRLYVFLLTKQKLLNLSQEFFTHLPYWTDIAQSDHLFHILSNSYGKKKFNCLEDIKADLL